MKIRLQLTDNPPTVTSQEKGETIKYKWIVRNGKRVSIPYIHHFEKPEVARARSFYTGRILVEIDIQEATEALNDIIGGVK